MPNILTFLKLFCIWHQHSTDPPPPIVKACDLVRHGGLLILSSPYTWKEEHTEVEKWIGGKYRDAEKCFTERGLETIVRGRGLALREDN